MTDTNTRDRWSDLEELARKATPGRWFVCECERLNREDHTTEFSGFEILGLDDAIVHSPDDGVQKLEDAAFIAAANPAEVLALISHARAVEAENARLRGVGRKLLAMADGTPLMGQQIRDWTEEARAALTEPRAGEG